MHISYLDNNSTTQVLPAVLEEMLPCFTERGSACTAGESDPSSVLMAMGLTGEQSRSSLRFSLGKLNTVSDIERVISELPAVVRGLREKSRIIWAAAETTNR